MIAVAYVVRLVVGVSNAMLTPIATPVIQIIVPEYTIEAEVLLS
jgi:hypothetical protein